MYRVLMLNGEEYNKTYFNYSDLIHGAVIDFDMGDTPSDWGTSEDGPADLHHRG